MDRPGQLEELARNLDEVAVGAMLFVAPAKLASLLESWAGPIETQSQASAMAYMLVLAADYLTLAPSPSGSTAFDRMAREARDMPAEQRHALDLMRKARTRLARFQTVQADGRHDMVDMATGEAFLLFRPEVTAEALDQPVLCRTVQADGGVHLFAGQVLPLDEPALAVAQRFVRHGGIVNAHRCVEAVYQFAVRHGAHQVDGLNAFPDDLGDEAGDGVGELDLIANLWSEPDAERDPEDVAVVRSSATLDDILDVLSAAAHLRDRGNRALSDAYASIASIQLETVQIRHAASSGSLDLDLIERELHRGCQAGALFPAAEDLLRELRRRLPSLASTTARDPALERLIARIQALRSKTVEQGCTEAEALSAAEKAAELLDRHGLSLGELEFAQQAAQGMSVQTNRRRTAPIDQCVPMIARFFDCRAWMEPGAAGALRYVFFGLSADVVAARYLYDLVDQVFRTETRTFQASETYVALQGGKRRTASNSFQMGLAHGIVDKLAALRSNREAGLRSASGRDIVVAKAHVVDAEMEKLGLDLKSRPLNRRTRILREAYDEGHEAGERFDYTPGLPQAR